MCGIIGFHAPGGTLGPWFDHAAMRASYRGPDGDGVWCPGWDRARRLADLQGGGEFEVPVALGHLRLSILDLSPAGSQPMVVPGRAAIVLNGEIYNFLEVREVLKEEGWTFQSSSDTEVLLKGYLAWGERVVDRLNGMWAFAIYDMERKGVFLSRDRFGEKPLFLASWRDGWAFASEIKQLMGFPDLCPELDVTIAGRYLATGHPYDGPSTWFKGVHQLEPGTCLWLGSEGPRPFPYYSLEGAVASVTREATAEAWAERFEEALDRSVALRLRSDVPVGSCLSEGLDSSAVLVAAMRLPHQGKYHAFTLGSEDPLIDERGGAERLSRAKGAEWHGIMAEGDDFSGLWDRMTWHQEIPVAGTSLYGQWKVMEAARAAGVIVLQDGQGADELLGGYHKFYVSHIFSTFKRRPLAALGLGVRFLQHLGVSPRLVKFGYRYARGLFNAPDPGQWLRPGLFEGASTPDVKAGALNMRIQDIRRWSLPNLLSYEDRNAMAHSVETRLPFLDPEVVRLGLAMPPEVTHHKGWTKWPIRRLLDRAGAKEAAWRRGKRGFAVPQDPWLDGQLRGQVQAWMDSPHPLWGQVVEPEAVKGFQALWRQGRRGHAVCDIMIQAVALDRFFRVWFPL